MSNSTLVSHIAISPNSNNPRAYAITKITIHHMAGNLTVEQCGNIFAPESRQASSNYGIGTDGRVGMYVEEHNRAWTSGDYDNDSRAITIEVANDEIGGNWHVSDVALARTIELCVDICRRNGIKSLNFTGDKNGNLTIHKMFQPSSCPGPYLESKMPYIAEQVNNVLNGQSHNPIPQPQPEPVNPYAEAIDQILHIGSHVRCDHTAMTVTNYDNPTGDVFLQEIDTWVHPKDVDKNYATNGSNFILYLGDKVHFNVNQMTVSDYDAPTGDVFIREIDTWVHPKDFTEVQ